MIKKIFNGNLNKLHIMNSIERLGWSMVGIFIPIYLLTLGFSLQQVFIYYIIQNTVILLTSFIVVYLGRIINIQKILIIRFPFLLIFLTILYNLQSIDFPIYLLAIIDGIQLMLYWFPLHILFAQFADKKNLGSSTSKLFAIPQFVTMFGPLAGGLITVTWGFKVLFIIATVLFFIAYIPILYTKILPIKYNFVFREGLDLYKKYKKYFYSEICNNIGEEVEGVIWPIFVYLSLINITSVGVIGTLLAVSSSVFTLIVGQLADKKNKTKLIKTSAIFIMTVWFLRLIFDNEIALYILTILSGMAFVVLSVPYYSIFYQIAQKEKAAVFFAFREIPVAIARIIVFTMGILFVANLKILFLLAGLVYLFFIFWKNQNNNELV
jgi:MFS family permease